MKRALQSLQPMNVYATFSYVYGFRLYMHKNNISGSFPGSIEARATLSSMSFPRLGLLLCGLCWAALGQAAPEPPLRLCFEDVEQRPWSLPDGSGLNFELL